MRARRTQLTSLLSLGRDVDSWGIGIGAVRYHVRYETIITADLVHTRSVRFRATIAVSGRGSSCARRRSRVVRCGGPSTDRRGSAPSPAWSPVSSAPDARGRPARTSSHTHRATPPRPHRARAHMPHRGCVTVCIPIDYRNYGEYAVGNITRDSAQHSFDLPAWPQCAQSASPGSLSNEVCVRGRPGCASFLLRRRPAKYDLGCVNCDGAPPDMTSVASRLLELRPRLLIKLGIRLAAARQLEAPFVPGLRLVRALELSTRLAREKARLLGRSDRV